MHDLALVHLVDLAQGVEAPSTNTGVPAAIIGAVALVAVALIAGWFGTRTNRAERRHPRRDARVSQAEWDSAHAENEQREAEAKCDRLEARVRVLETFLWVRRFDPNRISNGNERDGQVKR